MAYSGSEENRAYADAFVDQTIADPAAMVAALDLIGSEPVEAATFVRFVGDTTQYLTRINALGAAVSFLDTGVDSSVTFDPITEAVMMKDFEYRRLLRERQHSSPTRESAIVRQIRARRLALYAGRLAAANGAAREIA